DGASDNAVTIGGRAGVGPGRCWGAGRGRKRQRDLGGSGECPIGRGGRRLDRHGPPCRRGVPGGAPQGSALGRGGAVGAARGMAGVWVGGFGGISGGGAGVLASPPRARCDGLGGSIRSGGARGEEGGARFVQPPLLAARVWGRASDSALAAILWARAPRSARW